MAAGVLAISVALPLLYYSFVTDFDEWLDRMDHYASIAGGVAIVFAVIRYVSSREDAEREARRAKHFAAWSLINSAEGNAGNGGRFEAITDLLNDGVSLAGVNLSGAALPRLEIPPRADLRGASFGHVNNVFVDLSHARMSEARLEGARMSFAIVTSADFRRASMRGARLEHIQGGFVDMSQADLREIDCTNAKCENAWMIECDFSGAAMMNANFARSAFSRAHLARTNVVQTTFAHADLRGTRFTDSVATHANFTEANLEGADFSNARLDKVDFSRANLTNAVLRNARIDGANLTGAILNGADLSGMHWDHATKFDGATILHVKNAAPEFAAFAINHGAKSPSAND